jgi:hypothetical protein
MGKVITTLTDMSKHVGTYVRIAGSDCCWRVVGTSPPNSEIRNVEVVSTTDCYYYIGSEILSDSAPVIVTF